VGVFDRGGHSGAGLGAMRTEAVAEKDRASGAVSVVGVFIALTDSAVFAQAYVDLSAGDVAHRRRSGPGCALRCDPGEGDLAG